MESLVDSSVGSIGSIFYWYIWGGLYRLWTEAAHLKKEEGCALGELRTPNWEGMTKNKRG